MMNTGDCLCLRQQNERES